MSKKFTKVQFALTAAGILMLLGGSLWLVRFSQREVIESTHVYSRVEDVPDIKVETPEDKSTNRRMKDAIGTVDAQMNDLERESVALFLACIQERGQDINTKAGKEASKKQTTPEVQLFAQIVPVARRLETKMAKPAGGGKESDSEPVNAPFCGGRMTEAMEGLSIVLAYKGKIERLGINLPDKTVAPNFIEMSALLTHFANVTFPNYVQMESHTKQEDANKRNEALRQKGDE